MSIHYLRAQFYRAISSLDVNCAECLCAGPGGGASQVPEPDNWLQTVGQPALTASDLGVP